MTKKNWIVIIVMAVGIGALVGVAGATALTHEASTTNAAPALGNVGGDTTTEELATPCIDKDEASSAATKASASLTSATDELQSLNVDGAVVDVGLAAEYTRDSAVASAGAPEVADELYAAADAYDASSDALADYQIGRATAYMDEANDHVHAATAALDAGDYGAC